MASLDKSKELKIRLIKESDNSTMAKIIRQVMTEFGAVGCGYSIEDPEVDHIYEAYLNDLSAYYVIEMSANSEGESEILGGAGVGPLVGADQSVCELKKMYLLSQCRGLGLGTKLMDLCIETAQEKGFQEIYLETLDSMVQANRLYARYDFKKLDGPLGKTGHHGCDSWFIRSLTV